MQVFYFTCSIQEVGVLKPEVCEKDLESNVIGVVSEFEREMINKRATEGRKEARENEVVFGGKCKLNEDDMAKIAYLIKMGTFKPEIVKLSNI